MTRGRLAALVIGVFLFLGGNAGAVTLLEAARSLEGGARTLLDRVAGPEPTWGQAVALEDLGRLAEAAGDLRAALESGAPDLSPDSLQARVQALEVARSRFRASAPLLGARAEEAAPALLDQAARLCTALRALQGRFWGMAPVRGSALAAFPLGEAGQPLAYAGPADLALEGRSILSWARTMRADVALPLARRVPGYWGGGGGVMAAEEARLRDLEQAAADFETLTNSGYRDVAETRPAFRALRRAWERVAPYFGGGAGNLAAREMEEAIQRLEGFYGPEPAETP